MSTEIPQDKIKEQREELEQKREQVQTEIHQLQEDCAHPNNQTKYKGVVNVTVCPDCGLMDEY